MDSSPVRPTASSNSSKGVFIVILVIVGLVIVGAFVNMTEEDTLPSSGGISDSDLFKIVSDLNSNLPVMVDSETRWDTTAGVNNTIIYFYTIINYQKEEIDPIALKNELSPGIRSQVCTLPDLKTIRDNGMLMKYSYSDKDGDFIMDIEIDTKTCI